MAVSQSKLAALPVIGPTRDWTGVRFFCTTRVGGRSLPPYDSLNLGLGSGDAVEVVRANRNTLERGLPGLPFWLKQVHGVSVVDVDSLVAGQTGQEHEADAAITSQPERVLAILTADCLPVVIADAQGTVLGVAHAGWRGLAGGVLENTVASLQARQPGASAWRAWLGPAIGPKVFQVGDEVRQAFVQHGSEFDSYFLPDHAPGKWLADLPGLARARLNRAGVDLVDDCGACTVSDPGGRFFSYRRDGKTGRMATLAWLKRD